MGMSALAGATVVSGLLSSDAASNAASQQAASGRAAIGTQQQMTREAQALQEPFRQSGLTALQQIATGTQPGGQFATPFKMEDSQTQQFAQKQSLAAMQNQMAVGGQGLSSNAIVGAGTNAANIASQYEQQAYNQWLQSQQQALAPLEFTAGLGQAAASGQASNLGQAGSNISNLQTGIGNAQAAGTVGSANALGSAVGSAGQYMMMNSLLGKTSSSSSGYNSLQSLGLE